MGTAFSLCVIDAPSSPAESAEEDETTGVGATDQGDAVNANNTNNINVADNEAEPMVASESTHEPIAYRNERSGSVKRNTAAKIKDGNHCDKCGKKLGLTGGYACRCGGVFCALHRYSDRHDCTFDYRASGAEQIRRDNPVVTADKVRKL